MRAQTPREQSYFRLWRSALRLLPAAGRSLMPPYITEALTSGRTGHMAPRFARVATTGERRHERQNQQCGPAHLSHHRSPCCFQPEPRPQQEVLRIDSPTQLDSLHQRYPDGKRLFLHFPKVILLVCELNVTLLHPLGICILPMCQLSPHPPV